jgi:GTPase SAR1 family protein
MWKTGLHSLNNKYDICLLGEDGIGKSSLTYYYVHGSIPEQFDPHYENLYTKIITDGSSHTKASILDTSHANEYLSHRAQQLENARLFVLAFAIDNGDSFRAAQDISERIRQYDAPVAVFGLKSDRHSYRQILEEDAAAFAASINAVGYYECNTVSGEGIDAAFQPLVDILRLRPESPRAVSEELPLPTVAPHHDLPPLPVSRALPALPTGTSASLARTSASASASRAYSAPPAPAPLAAAAGCCVIT